MNIEDNVDLLITFIGRTPKNAEGYRKTTYDFGINSAEDNEESAFFGWTLQKRIKAKKVLILGTETSMWDHLFEQDIDLGDTLEKERMNLMEAVENNQPITQEQLDHLTPALSEALGYTTKLRIIPFCKTDDEQSQLLKIFSEEVEPEEKVHIDVTHGFRHLPMLSLLAAFYLEHLYKAEISQIWYGSFDQDTNKAPVYKLSGLLEINEWLQAIAAFDKDGNYAIFVPLLKKAGFSNELTNKLKEAAYFENVLNIGEATARLRKVIAELKTPPITLQAAHSLFLPTICERLEWVTENKQFEKQIKLAGLALERGDYLRSILYAYESIITQVCQQTNTDVNSFDGRENARKKYEDKLKKNKKSDESKNYKLLKNLRNQVAHGSRGTKKEVQQVLLDEMKMKEKLQELITSIKNDEIPTQ